MLIWSGNLEDKTVPELRAMLEPYGTAYRLRLKKHELISVVRQIRHDDIAVRQGEPDGTPPQATKDGAQ